MKNGKVVDHIEEYFRSKGQKGILNPTVISKLIYGVASIMNRLHRNHIFQNYLIDNIFLDDKLEPRINLSRYSYIISERPEMDYDDIVFPIKFFSPEYFDDPGFPSDVFEFGYFVYLMLTGNQFIKKFNLVRYMNFITQGERPPRV